MPHRSFSRILEKLYASARAAVQVPFPQLNPIAIGMALAALLALHCLGTAVYDWIFAGLEKWWAILISVEVLLLLVICARCYFRPEDRLALMQIHPCPSPRVSVLIVFLSKPPRLAGEELLQAIPDFARTQKSNPEECRKVFETWQMPFVAILKNLEWGLKLVVTIPSADLPAIGPIPPVPGTWHSAALFSEAVAKLTDGKVKVATLADYSNRFLHGVGYEEVDKVLDAIHDVLGCLMEGRKGRHTPPRHHGVGERYPASEILIDITSGQRTSGAVGMAVTLEDMNFQYVSTETYAVKVYNVYHSAE